MYAKKIVITLLIILITAISFGGELRFNGQIENYTGILIENGDYAKLENSFSLKMEYNGANRIFVNPILENQNSNQDLNLLLKQAYIDLYFRDFDLRVGKQQIIWGKANGVFVTDVISPKNLQEFILPDFEEIRIAVNAAKLNYYINNSNVELIFIPQFQPNELPEEGSIWSPNKPAQMSTANIDYTDLNIDSNIENSEVAFKYSSLNEFADFEIMGAYLWGDIPVNYMYPNEAGVTVKPEYEREILIGGTFAKTFNNFIMRNEVAFYKDKKFQIEDMSQNGVADKNYLNYVLGIDYTLLGINLGNQIVQEFILDYDDKIVNDEIDTTLTINANNTFFRETLTNQMFVYYNLNNQDSLIKPSSQYNFGDGLNLTLGANIFVGDEGDFGQFNENSMVYSKLRYDF